MRLLLVEDDEHVAAALVAILRRHGFDVTHVATGEDAISLLSDRAGFGSFGAVLLDLSLPDVDGFEICGRIRRVSAVPILMVTARADVRSRIHGLNLGADDYIVKPYDTGELLARIHAVSRRTAPAGTGSSRPGGDVLAAGPVTVELATRQVSVDGQPVTLTRKEFDLLALLARRPGVVFRREQIISDVWQTSWEGTSRTLEVHIASLRAKLRRPELVETVRGVGYRLALPAS
ncbi:response regulator transcription factor [Streptomyces sp. 7-21]|uniref:response regulator transcription factor n=1 Tax=Streptomyces sp. 7-21 TaxID=2802283 RepID=UPI00191F7B02|nr:response regulator transcription factor [Streptomyces sp. 7-21]MBL1067133.1 response regulator transcription factor [Streptomyces sp. 7-21]